MILLVCCSAAVVAAAKTQSAKLNAGVEAGKFHATRLGNLPEGAKLAVGIETDGRVAVLLLNEADAAAFPDIDGPVFEGRTSDRLDFSLRVPGSGDYYLVVDNREGAAARKFTLAVTASAESAAGRSEALRAKLEQAHAELDKLEASLRKVFAFEDLEFRLGRCGSANAFSGGGTIYICAEIGKRLMDDIGDEAKARDALLFAMLHEVAHVLLEQWDYPFYDNEEVADEFATVLMVMFGQGEKARTQAEYFSTLSPDEELEQKRDRDDRHPLSVQRARNITAWLDDPQLVKRWQKILVPHMQTEALRALAARPKGWVDSAIVRAELERREADPNR